MPGAVDQVPTLVTVNGLNQSTFAISFAATPTLRDMVYSGGMFIRGSGVTLELSSVTDNQSNTYKTGIARSLQGTAPGLMTAGWAFKINSSGTFTITITMTTSAATFAAYGALEISGCENEVIDAYQCVNNFDITTNDVLVRPTGSKTKYSTFMIAELGINTNFSALTLTDATGYTNRYLQNATASFPGWLLATKNDSASGEHTCQFNHNNGSFLTGGSGLVIGIGDGIQGAGDVRPRWPASRAVSYARRN